VTFRGRCGIFFARRTSKNEIAIVRKKQCCTRLTDLTRVLFFPNEKKKIQKKFKRGGLITMADMNKIDVLWDDNPVDITQEANFV
jgi:hypothetical protein